MAFDYKKEYKEFYLPKRITEKYPEKTVIIKNSRQLNAFLKKI